MFVPGGRKGVGGWRSRLSDTLLVRQLTIVVPYLASDPEQESALRTLPPALAQVVERGTVKKLSPMEQSVTPEAAWLGIAPGEAQVPQGPLTVAALRHDPPDGSVHFHLTLCSADAAGRLEMVTEAPSDEEVRIVFQAAEQLRTGALTPLAGEGTDHALVWEDGSIEMSSEAPTAVVGEPLLAHAPQGDGEKTLRRFIDDAVNLLSALELNHVRTEEGRPPLNCLWPWGQGFRPDLPNLALQRGDVAHVESGSMRMEGLSRLVGYTHGDRAAFGRGLKIDYARMRDGATGGRPTLALLHNVEEMQRHGRLDEIAWSLERLSEAVVEPLLGDQGEHPFMLRLAAPGGCASLGGSPDRASSTGLALEYDSRRPGQGRAPFDERALDDPRLPAVHAWEFVRPGLSGAY